MTGRRAVFMDRDGVVIREVHLLTNPDDVDLMIDAADAIYRLRCAGFVTVIVTNQAVVARGLCDEAAVDRVHARLLDLLMKRGARVDGIYVCPHHPSATLAMYRLSCECRKPKPGLLLRAARDLDLDLARSFMVGDRMSDVAAGRRAGCSTVLIKSDSRPTQPIESDSPVLPHELPDRIRGNLATAADAIIRKL